jgi:uncharacterized protein YdeI (YjbR/CyaY-like superfamily)
LAPTCQKQFIGWIVTTKRPETRAKRIEESLAPLATGERLELKEKRITGVRAEIGWDA